MEEYIGIIKMFAGTYAPRGWSFCHGQSLAISNYNALYAILGTQFGGDGRVTFNLPDLRGRVPVGAGNGPGLTSRQQGALGGRETAALTVDNIPTHNHSVKCDVKTGGRSLSATPQNNVPASITQGEGYGQDISEGTLMNQSMVTNAGGGQPHDNMQPFAAINYIICIEGLFPPRT